MEILSRAHWLRANKLQSWEEWSLLAAYESSAVFLFLFFQMVYSDSLVSLRGHRNKLVHIVSSLICWLFPFVPIGIVLGSKTTSYVVVNLRFCYPNGSDIAFFTTPFIVEVAQGVGCTCLLVVVYKLFMVSLRLG